MKSRTVWIGNIVILALVATLQVSVRTLVNVDANLLLPLNLVCIAIIFGFPSVCLMREVLRWWNEPEEPEPLMQSGPLPIIQVIRGGAKKR